MKKPHPYIVIAFTALLLILIIVVVSYNFKGDGDPDMEQLKINAEEYVAATTNIELPDGNIIQTAAVDDLNVNKGWIGAQLTDLPADIKEHLKYPDSSGVYVQDTHRSGPAQTAGILPGDIITLVNNVEAQSVLNTLNVISALTPGKSYQFAVFRQGEYLEYAVNISARQ